MEDKELFETMPLFERFLAKFADGGEHHLY